VPKGFPGAIEARLYPASLRTKDSDDEPAKAARPGSTLQSLPSTRRFMASRADAAFRWTGYAEDGSHRGAGWAVLIRIGFRSSPGFIERMPSSADRQS